MTISHVAIDDDVVDPFLFFADVIREFDTETHLFRMI